MQDCYASRISDLGRQKNRIGRQAGKKTAGSQEDRWAGWQERGHQIPADRLTEYQTGKRHINRK
jgi:hypothetical protein